MNKPLANNSSFLILNSSLRVEVERKKIKHTHLSVFPPDARVHVSAPVDLSDADLKLNEKYKQEEVEKFNLAGGERKEQPGQGRGGYGGGAPGGWESMLAKMSDMERRIDEKLRKYKELIAENSEEA